MGHPGPSRRLPRTGVRGADFVDTAIGVATRRELRSADDARRPNPRIASSRTVNRGLAAARSFARHPRNQRDQGGTIENVRDKANVVRMLRESRTYVQNAVNAMTPADLAKTTELYGRQVPKWSVLLQLVSHMNEHLGQSIAYARMNGIAPPWSQ